MNVKFVLEGMEEAGSVALEDAEDIISDVCGSSGLRNTAYNPIPYFIFIGAEKSKSYLR